MACDALSLANVHAFYGDSHILHGVSFALQPGGVLAVHVSNTHLDLAPGVGLAADSLGQRSVEQTLALGPVASQEAIKMLGTNGGGVLLDRPVRDRDPRPGLEVRVEPGLAGSPAGAAVEGHPLVGRDARLFPVGRDLGVGPHREMSLASRSAAACSLGSDRSATLISATRPSPGCSSPTAW